MTRRPKPKRRSASSHRPDAARPPRRSGGRRRRASRWRRLLARAVPTHPAGKAIAAITAGLIAVSALLGLALWRFAAKPGPELPRAVPITWPAGLDAGEAADLLAELDLSDRPFLLSLYLWAKGASECFVAGPHLLSGGATPAELAAMLCRSGARPTVKVTVVEGFHRFAIAERLERLGVASREAFLAASADRELLDALGIAPASVAVADTAEGFLFPATYVFRRDSDAPELVRIMVRETNRRLDRLIARHPDGFASLRDELRLDRRQILALASMVEKEAALAEEMPLIASVFLNRLRDPAFRRLQSDPTSIYGCHAMPKLIPACRHFDDRATPELNRDPANLYSTYVVDHLPPGPIANPGEGAIAAVLAPAETDYRYFVASGGGRHTFSKTYDEHLRAIRQPATADGREMASDEGRQ